MTPEATDSLLESSHSFMLAESRCRKVRTRLTDVRVAEPTLYRREWDAGIHPARARLPAQVVEVQVLDLGTAARELPGCLDGPPTLPNFVPKHKQSPG